MSERPSICYLLESTEPSGGAKLVFEQAHALAEHGFDVVIATLDGPPAWFELPVSLRTVPDFGGRNLPSADLYVGTSLETVRSAHDTGIGVGAHLVQRYEGDQGGRLEHAAGMIEFVYLLKTVKIAVSPHLARAVEERFGRPCRVVRSGIDSTTFHARARTAGRTPPRIVVSGSFGLAHERVPMALEALAMLRAEGHPFEVVRISQDAQSDAERALLAVDEFHHQLPAERVAGVLRSTEIALSAADASEVFGASALEAMACGCAAVLSDVSAHRAFAAPLGGWAEHAVFVEGDAASFADGVRELLLDPSRRAALGTSGAELAARHGWDIVGPELADGFRALLAAERRRWAVRSERMVPGECEQATEAIHWQHYLHARAYAHGSRVVDAGAGVGYGSQLMAQSGAARVLALDYADEALDYARENYDHPSISWERADLRDRQWEPDSADLITCFEVYEHLVAPQPMIGGFARALADDGRLLVSTPNGERYSNGATPDNIHHIREYDIEEFSALLRAHFGRVHLLGQSARGAQLVLQPADRARDASFLAECTQPRSHTPAQRCVVVGTPDWYDPRRAWLALVERWCATFDDAAPVTLELLAEDLSHAHRELLVALGELGLDPEKIPDLALIPARELLPVAAERFVHARAWIPLGTEDHRLRRMAEASAVAVLEDPAPVDLRAVAGTPGAPRT